MAIISLPSTLAILPICQKTIDASSVCSSAMNFIIAKIEHKNPLTIIPESTSIILFLFLNNLGIEVLKYTANKPPIKAISCLCARDAPSIMARAAPTEAPEETPSKSGEINGFLKTP